MRRFVFALVVLAVASLGVQFAAGPVDRAERSGLSPAGRASPIDAITLDTAAVLVAATTRPPLAPWRSGGFDPTVLAVVLGVAVAAGVRATRAHRRRTDAARRSSWVTPPRRGPPLLTA